MVRSEVCSRSNWAKIRTILPRVLTGGCRVLDMDRTVAPHGQGLFDRLTHPVRTDGEDRDLRGVAQLLFQLDRLLHGVLVVLVHPPGQVGLVVPYTLAVRLEPGLHVRYLLDTD